MQNKLLATIPQPKQLPVLKNLLQVDPRIPVQSISALARDFDGIYKLVFPDTSLIILTSQELVNEICDERRFKKKLHRTLVSLQELAGDGLFTAETGDENWSLAHRVLMPAFGPQSLRNLWASMMDIAEQMLLKWERYGDEHEIEVSDDMTRLTLDTIALASFDYRFNSFYEKEMHPFVDAMLRSLDESGHRTRRPERLTKLMLPMQKRFRRDNMFMHELARKIIQERRRKGEKAQKKDLLHYMLNSELSEENIIYQMVTFLIAGHETTSGMLSFTIYEILKNPQVLKRLQREVDEILGNRTPTFEDLPKFTYLDQVFKESLRLWPTAPAWAVHPLEEKTVIGGKYEVKKNDTLMVMLPALHRDPKVWEEPEKFDPDRMTLEKFRSLPPNAWKPFGNGQRACIGRGFALQEATLIMAMILQRFDLEFADPLYELKVKETLTLKPEGLRIRARRRRDRIIENPTVNSPGEVVNQELPRSSPKDLSLQILYGSNTGTSETFAKRIAEDGKLLGAEVSVEPLDTAVDNLPRGKAVVIVASSYEGRPPHNARKFIRWIEGLEGKPLEGVSYAVFGCGNRDWKETYQAVPRSLDERMSELGATRLFLRGEADAAGDFTSHFEAWYSEFRQCLLQGNGD